MTCWMNLKRRKTMKKPTEKITPSQLAASICLLKPNEELNFSEEPDGSEYWGAVCISQFESTVILIGYYGTGAELMIKGDGAYLFNELSDILEDYFKDKTLWYFQPEAKKILQPTY